MSFVNSSSDSPLESFSTRLLRAGFELDKAVTPYLCLFGALGNSLSIALFTLNRKYRSQSSSYYLSTLAISDTGFLLNLFLVWYESMYGGVITSGFRCRLVMYLGQVTCFTSIYVMVGFSIERYIAVRNPLSKRQICTKSRAKKGIIGVTCAALILFSYVWFIARLIKIQHKPNGSNFWQNGTSLANSYNFSEDGNSTAFGNLREFPISKNEDEQFDANSLQNSNDSKQPSPVSKFDILEPIPVIRYCTVPKKYHHISEVANYLDTIITLIIPFLVILFCNIKIVMALQRLRKDRQIFLSPSSNLLGSNKTTTGQTGNPSKIETLKPRRCKSDVNVANPFVADRVKFCKRGSLQEPNVVIYQSVCKVNSESSENRATKLLLLVSSIFLLLNLPLHVIRCAQFVQSFTGSNEEKDVFAALQPWANLLFNTNFALNFVLYCVSGKNFRRAVKHTALAILCKTTKNPPKSLKATPHCLVQNKKKTLVRLSCKIKGNVTKGGSLKACKTSLEHHSEFGSTLKFDKVHATTL